MDRMSTAGIAALLFALLSHATTTGASEPPIPMEKRLENCGLPGDGSVLVRYLSEGLPGTLRCPEGVAVEDFRWGVYKWLPQVLAEMRTSEAVSTLADRLRLPLPEFMRQDLETRASRSRAADAERARDILYEEAVFQAFCAEALGVLGDASAVAPLRHFMERMTTGIKGAASDKNGLVVAYEMGFDRAAIALASLGESAAIPAALELMALRGVDPWPATRVLKVVTGQTYGPAIDSPAHLRQHELAKWTQWWVTNRESFHPLRGAVLGLAHTPMLNLDSQDDTLRGKLRVLEQVRNDPKYGPIASHPLGRWMEEQGREKSSEIAAIMNDPDETFGVRLEAMQWYARFGGKAALKTLERYVKWDVPFDPEDEHHCERMGAQAYEIIRDMDPKRCYRLSEWTIEKRGHISGFWAFDAVNKKTPKKAVDLARKQLLSEDKTISAAATRILMTQDPDGTDTVARQVDRLDAYAQRTAVESLTAFDSPAATTILGAALKSDDFDTAFCAVGVIRERKLSSALPEDSKKAFQQRNADPRYRP
jgi:HEAT repeat protein